MQRSVGVRTQAARTHGTYPYLPRYASITRPNQVWCSDITFIPVRGGLLHLVANRWLTGVCMQTPKGTNWATRKALSWRLSSTMHADLCVGALTGAMERHGPPEIMNTDQGSQFTGAAWLTTRTEAGVRILMDGRGRCMDNIFIERLWQSLKQEAIRLTGITGGFHARRATSDRINFCNEKRPHTAPGRRTPNAA